MKCEMERLEEMMKQLPSEGGDIDVETVGRQLDEEMKRMGEAISAAVAHIGELQKKRFSLANLSLSLIEKNLVGKQTVDFSWK